MCVTVWSFSLDSDIPWLGVLFLEDESTWRWGKAGATSAAPLQAVKLSLTTYSRRGVDAKDVRIALHLGEHHDTQAAIHKTMRSPIVLQASQPLIAPHLQTGATVRSGSVVDLATVHLAEGLRARLLMVPEMDTESRWRGQWRVKPEIPGDFPAPLACLREWRLSGSLHLAERYPESDRIPGTGISARQAS
jgi:hypothetical protein